MFKKILFISLVVSFSTTVISKEKVFLDYGFLKDISTRTDKACELNASGKTVKADKLLKEISQELTNYFSKRDTFYLKKECSLALSSNNFRGSLECLPDIFIGWGDNISKKVLEQIEDSKNDTDEIVFISGEFKLNNGLISNSRFTDFQDCPVSPRVNIYASPISIKVSKKEWSAFQGNMTWNEAKVKCEIIGMRLPTKEELEFAPRINWNKEAEVAEKLNTNKESGVMDFNAETDSYWTLYKVIGFPPGNGEDNDELPTDEDLKTWKYSVRCIEGKEFKFKK